MPALDDLHPYRSLLLCTCPTRWPMSDAVKELRQQAEDLEEVVQVETASNAVIRHGVRVLYFYYRRERPPTWLLTQDYLDHLHELVVVFRKRRQVAILATEGRLRDQIRSKLNTSNQTVIGMLAPIPAATLNAVFVRGRTNILWLSGTHRQVVSRVDNKAISGSDLLYALDPLGDQTFFFTAAVSQLPQNAYAYKVGVSPRRSYVWGGPSANGGELCEGVATLFRLIENAPPPSENPLPVLAAPAMDSASLAAVQDAYEAALLPSELLAYDLPADLRELAEKWCRLEFDITATNSAEFDARISLADAAGTRTQLGAVRFRFNLSRPERITWTVTSLTPPHADRELHDQAVELLNNRRSWLKVWYESGHTLADQTIFKLRFRDAQFDHCFCEFGGFDVKKEKPHPLTVADIGAQDSLFCWVRRRWHRALPQAGQVAGWLSCNDGSMEMADFIHFDRVDAQAELTLIHVKGSTSNAADRRLSVADYEVVVGQAIKNLRFLDLQSTTAAFTDFLSHKLVDAAWRAGAANTRANMLAAMTADGPPPKRRVVVVQPRCTRSAMAAARAGRDAKQALIAKQLDALLLGAKANCQALGADFLVVGENA